MSQSRVLNIHDRNKNKIRTSWKLKKLIINGTDIKEINSLANLTDKMI